MRKVVKEQCIESRGRNLAQRVKKKGGAKTKTEKKNRECSREEEES